MHLRPLPPTERNPHSASIKIQPTSSRTKVLVRQAWNGDMGIQLEPESMTGLPPLSLSLPLHSPLVFLSIPSIPCLMSDADLSGVGMGRVAQMACIPLGTNARPLFLWKKTAGAIRSTVPLPLWKIPPSGEYQLIMDINPEQPLEVRGGGVNLYVV